GIAYGLSGMLVVHMIHPNMIQHLAWFPLIVYLFYRGVNERSWFHSLLSGLVLGVTLLSGHPQSALYIIFFLFCLTIFLAVRDIRSGDGARTSTLVKGLIAAAIPVAIGVGIFAIQLLPSQELAGLSERAEMSHEKSLEGSLTMGQLVTLVAPKFFGVAGPDESPAIPFWLRPERYYFWETAIYIGVVTLLLSIVGVASRRLKGLGWFLGGMALLGLFYALGDSFFVHPLLGRLPLFSTFRIPTRMAMYLAFGGALLGGVGLEQAIRGGERNEKLSKVILIAGGAVVFFALLIAGGLLSATFGAPEELASHLGSTGIGGILLGGAAAVIIWLALRDKLAPNATGGLLILLCVVDLFMFGMGQNDSKTNPEQDLYQKNDEQFAQLKAAPPDKIFMVKMREAGAMLMQRNQGPYSNIMLYEGYNPLLLLRRVPPAPTPESAYDLLDIRYDVKIDSVHGQAGLAARTTAYPHVRMVYNAQVTDTASSRELMKSGRVDLAKTVVLEEDPGVTLDGTGTGQAKLTKYDASEIQVGVTTDKPGILVMSEIWYPAWHVSIDGAPAKLLTADYSLRGVAVPAGTHTVLFRFESSAFRTGMWVTLVTFVIALGGVIVTGLARRSGRKTGEPESALAGDV
ncbi:MAG: hypothetical protein ABI876_11245, partial [Bacteroidota bacterium]